MINHRATTADKREGSENVTLMQLLQAARRMRCLASCDGSRTKHGKVSIASLHQDNRCGIGNTVNAESREAMLSGWTDQAVTFLIHVFTCLRVCDLQSRHRNQLDQPTSTMLMVLPFGRRTALTM